MENHGATIKAPNSAHRNPESLMRSDGEEWEVIDQAAGNITLQPGMANVVIFPKIGKAQEY